MINLFEWLILLQMRCFKLHESEASNDFICAFLGRQKIILKVFQKLESLQCASRKKSYANGLMSHKNYCILFHDTL
jgi:hypothetical protein